MAGEVVVTRVAREREAAVDDAYLRIAELRGCLLGRPKEVRARELAHVSDFTRRRPRDEEDPVKARRSTALIATLALTIAAIVVGSVPAAAASKGGSAPSVSFTRSDLSAGTPTDGTQYGGGGLTLSASEPLTSGTYTDPFAVGGPRDISFQSGTWTSAAVASFAFDELVASWNAATP